MGQAAGKPVQHCSSPRAVQQGQTNRVQPRASAEGRSCCFEPEAQGSRESERHRTAAAVAHRIRQTVEAVHHIQRHRHRMQGLRGVQVRLRRLELADGRKDQREVRHRARRMTAQVRVAASCWPPEEVHHSSAEQGRRSPVGPVIRIDAAAVAEARRKVPEAARPHRAAVDIGRP